MKLTIDGFRRGRTAHHSAHLQDAEVKIRFTLIPNGFQRAHVLELASAMAEAGLSFDLIGSDQYDRLRQYPEINYIDLMGAVSPDQSLFQRLRRDVRYGLRLLAYAWRSSNQVYHYLWFRHALVEGVGLTLVLRAMGKKVVYTAFNPLPHDSRNIYTRWVFKVVYRTVNEIVVLTPALKESIVEEFSVPRDRIAVVERGLYEARDHPERKAADARRLLGLEPTDKVLLFFGKISAYKGLDLALAAHAEASQKLPDLKLVVAGKVLGPYRDTFQRLAETYAGPNLVMRPGHVAGDDLESMFKAADVVLLPYTHGSQSGVMFLAYAYGRPVIAPSMANFPADVVPGKTGLLFNVGDHSDLATTIVEGYRSGLFSAEGSEESIRAFTDVRYSWLDAARKLESLYQGLMTATAPT